MVLVEAFKAYLLAVMFEISVPKILSCDNLLILFTMDVKWAAGKTFNKGCFFFRGGKRSRLQG